MHTLELSDYASTSAVTLEALATVAMHVASDSTRVVFGVGAGISTAAGIPDFRGSATSLYGVNSVRHPTRGHSTLHDTRLATTRTATRTKELFHYDALLRSESRAEHLRMMAMLRKAAKRATRKGKEFATSDEAADGSRGSPTAFHGLMKRLAENGRLARVYSQNVDGLEVAAGLTAASQTLASSQCGSKSASPFAEHDDSSSDFDRPRRKNPRRRSPPTPSPQELPVVALHGSLDHVLCGVCHYRELWKGRHTKAFKLGRTLPCPNCHNRAQSRVLRSKRAIKPPPLAFLRPAVVLYDDPSFAASPAAHLISSTIEADLQSQPACLIVAGTSLRIPGFRSLVKDMSRAVRRNGGWSILVNRETVGKEWDTVFDYHFLGDTEVFANHLTAFLDSFVPVTSPAIPEPPSVLTLDPLSDAQTPNIEYRALPPLSALSLPPTPPSSAHSPLPSEPRTRIEKTHVSRNRKWPPLCSPIKVKRKRQKVVGSPLPFDRVDGPEMAGSREAASAYPSPPPSSQVELGPVLTQPTSSLDCEVLTTPGATVTQLRADKTRKHRNHGALSIAEVLRRAEKQARRRRREDKRARTSAKDDKGQLVAA